MNTYDFLDLIYYIFTLAILFPIGIGIFYWSDISKAVWPVTCFLIFLAAIEIIAVILQFNIIRNHFLYYFNTLGTLVFTAVFFSSQENKKICLGVAGFIALLMPFEILIVGFNHINSVTLTFSRIVLSVFSLLELRKSIANDPISRLSNNPFFFVYLGLLIIGAFTLITSAFKSNFIDTSLNLYYFFDTLSVMTNAIGFFVLMHGFWLIKKYGVDSIGS